MRPPLKLWLLRVIIIRVVVYRHFDLKSFLLVTLIFLIKCHPVIFRMSHHKNLSAFICNCKENTCLFRFCENCQFLYRADILCTDLSMSGMRCHEAVIKSTNKRYLTVHNMMFINTKLFLRKKMLLKSVMII